MAESVKALTKAGVTLTQDHADMIFRKFRSDKNGAFVVRKIKLAILLKKSNKDLKLSDGFVCFFDEEFMQDKFFNNQENDQDKDGSSTINEVNNDNNGIKTLNKDKQNESNKSNNDEKLKKALAKGLIKHLEKKLKGLDLNKINIEKSVLEGIANQLKQENLFSDKESDEFRMSLFSNMRLKVFICNRKSS